MLLNMIVIVYYINNIFPILKEGVLIHIHDIFLPYNIIKLVKRGRFGMNNIFIYAFLMNNNNFKIKSPIHMLKNFKNF